MRKRPAVSELERHYSRFSDERQRLEAAIVHAGVSGPALRQAHASELGRCETMLAHLVACLELIEPGWTVAHVQVKRHRRSKPVIERSALMDRAYAILRETTTPLTTAEVVELSARREDGLTLAQAHDPALRSALTTLLRRQAKAGGVRASRGSPVRWSIIRSPQAIP